MNILDTVLFSWVGSLETMVSNFYIWDTLGCFEEFLGVFSADGIDKNIFKSKLQGFEFVILNTEEIRSKRQGHWISLSRYFKENQVILELFDSFGYPVRALHKNIQDVIKNTQFNTFLTNNRVIQHPESNYCGFFTIARFVSLKTNVSIEDFLSGFSSETAQNDTKVIKYIRSIYSKK